MLPPKPRSSRASQSETKVLRLLVNRAGSASPRHLAEPAEAARVPTFRGHAMSTKRKAKTSAHGRQPKQHVQGHSYAIAARVGVGGCTQGPERYGKITGVQGKLVQVSLPVVYPTPPTELVVPQPRRVRELGCIITPIGTLPPVADQLTIPCMVPYVTQLEAYPHEQAPSKPNH